MINLDGATAEVTERARRVRVAQLEERRLRESNCAIDFLVLGNEDGRHDKRCICSPTCSRDYQPRPYPEAEPHNLKEYEGTGIGLLYGLASDNPGPDERRMLLSLAGWNLLGPPERLLAQEYAASPTIKESP